MFVTSFWFSCKIRDYSSYELNYTEVLHSSVYGLYCDKTKLFLISWADFKATWRVVVDKLWITPVYASHKATSTRTCKNNIRGWEILPSSDKEITPLKSSLTLGYNLRKRIVLVLLTAVDLRLLTVMYAVWPANICLESTSLPPKGFQNVLLISITIFISSYLHFLFKCKWFADLCQSQSRLFTTKYYVTKRKSLQCFDQRIFRAFPGNLHKSKKFSVVYTGRENE